MKGSLIVVGFFALGCLLGWSGYLPGVIIENDITVYVLYLLMFQVGISIGSDKKLKDILSSIRPKLLLVPLATIIGTLSFSALISLALTKWSVFDCLDGRKRFRLLFIILHLDNRAKRTDAGGSIGGGVRNDRLDR